MHGDVLAPRQIIPFLPHFPLLGPFSEEFSESLI